MQPSCVTLLYNRAHETVTAAAYCIEVHPWDPWHKAFDMQYHDIYSLADRLALLPSHFLRTAAREQGEQTQWHYTQVATGGARRPNLGIKIMLTAGPALDMFWSNR